MDAKDTRDLVNFHCFLNVFSSMGTSSLLEELRTLSEQARLKEQQDQQHSYESYIEHITKKHSEWISEISHILKDAASKGKTECLLERSSALLHEYDMIERYDLLSHLGFSVHSESEHFYVSWSEFCGI